MSDQLAGFLEAVEKLPAYSGLVWRASTGEVTVSVPLGGPVPTTRDVRYASENFRAPVLQAIIACDGRDIAPLSADPAAGEVVLLPEGMLTPATAVHEVAGQRVQVLLEVRPGLPFGAAPDDAALAAAIEAARAAGDVHITAPGRFGA